MRKKIALLFALLSIVALFVACSPNEAVYVHDTPAINVTIDDTPAVKVDVTNASINITAEASSTISSGNITIVNPYTNPVQVYVQSENYTNSIPYNVAIAEGIVSGHTPFYKLGYNAAVGTSEEDIWHGSVTYVFPTVAQQMQVVSSVSADNATGTGVRSIIIYYLDSSYAEHTTDVTLNGTTAVTTSVSNIFRINSYRALTTGTGYKAAGNIALQNTAGTVNYCYITAGFTRARNSAYTVPAGKELYISDYYVGVGGLNANQLCRVTLKATYNDVDNTLLTAGLFFMSYAEVVQANGSTNRQFTVPIKIPEKADVKVSAYTDSGSAFVEIAYRGWLE